MNKKSPNAGHFKKGQSGNPLGKPKGIRQIDKLLKEMLDSHEIDISFKYNEGKKVITKNVSLSCDKDKTLLQAAIFVQLRKALVDEDLRALEFIVTRAYGRPKEVAIDENLIDAKSIPILKMSQRETDAHLKHLNESY